MKKRIKNKFLSAAVLGLLVISGGILAIPAVSANNQIGQIQKNNSILEKNPEKFLQTENLGLKNGFQYSNNNLPGNLSIGETNQSVNEGPLEAAVEAGDYDAWKEALQKIDGFSENASVINKEDFDILVALNRSNPQQENEKTEF